MAQAKLLAKKGLINRSDISASAKPVSSIEFLMDEITGATATVDTSKTGINIRVDILMPSLNRVVRLNALQFHALNNVWHRKMRLWLRYIDKDIFAGSAVSVAVQEHAARPHDVDNVICKSLIDGLVHSGLIKDDNHKFVREYKVILPEIIHSMERFTTINITGDPHA